MGLEIVSQDGACPEHKWAEIQRVNNFSLCKELPIPSSFKRAVDLLQLILRLIQCSEFDGKLRLIESLNFSRNYQELEALFNLLVFQEHAKNLRAIKNAVLNIDFAQLADIPSHAVSEKKQFLYHEALKSII